MKVVSFVDLGWMQVMSAQGHFLGWSRRLTLELECGHSVQFHTPPKINRNILDSDGPTYVPRCAKCDAGEPVGDVQPEEDGIS